MFRYIAFVWDAKCSLASREARELAQRILTRHATQWELVYQNAAGVSVYCTGVTACSGAPARLASGEGIVLGTLFQKPNGDIPPSRVYSLNSDESHRAVESRGRHLASHYWGRYVAILCDQPNRCVTVFRDPTGGLECFHTAYGAVHLYFSYTYDCGLFDFGQYQIDWNYVAAAVSTFLPDTHETGLRQVKQLLGGERHDHRLSEIRLVRNWDPFEIARSEIVENFDSASEQLRRVVTSCVWAWASTYSSILHALSGGLDSSIVLGALTRAPSRPSVSCLNYYYLPGSPNDEREFARVAALEAQCTLFEHELDPHFSLEPISQLPRSVQPYNSIFELGVESFESAFLATHRTDAIFGGFGGDQVFFQNAAEFAAADYLYTRGFRAGLLPLAIDLARIEKTSVWHVIRSAIRDGVVRKASGPLLDRWRLSQLVSPDVRTSITRARSFLPPICAAETQCAPGTLWHVTMMLFADRIHGPFARSGQPECVHPLVSQPVVELCLRTPTYVHSTRGRDRAVARDAFRAQIPAVIQRRRAKGAVYEYPKAILAHNMSVIRDTLLNGRLVREGIADRAKLEACLTGKPTKDFGFPAELFSFYATEIWISSWSSGAAQAAA